MKLQNKTAIITGATAGMGKAMAYLFAKEGASLVLVARRKERLESVVNSITSNGGKAVACVGDVSKQEDIDNIVKTAIDTYGKIDIAVNNAGIMDGFNKVETITDEKWNQVINVNLTGPMRLYRAVIPEMLKNGGGSLITVASIGGLYGKISGVAYTASKHGVIGMAKNTAWMYAKQGIRSNVIAPGAVNTEISSSMDPANMDAEGYQNCEGFIKINPKTGEADEIAEIALFLASDESSLINGAVITADGGWTA
ncbi:MAG: SDR family oxidoreductase [Methanosphaera stadtmanae]|nr:SDR family oxidoreductase [Methanosphaera stadtmanae]